MRCDSTAARAGLRMTYYPQDRKLIAGWAPRSAPSGRSPPARAAEGKDLGELTLLGATRYRRLTGHEDHRPEVGCCSRQPGGIHAARRQLEGDDAAHVVRIVDDSLDQRTNTPVERNHGVVPSIDR